MFTSKRGFGEYNSLDDYYLQGYFTNKQLRKELRKAGLINRDGTPVPESIYRTNVAKAERRRKEKEELTKCLVAESINLQWQYENEIKSRLEEIQKLERLRKLRLETRTVNKKPQTRVKKKDIKLYLTALDVKRAQSVFECPLGSHADHMDDEIEHIRTLMTVQFLGDEKDLAENEDESESLKDIYVEQTTRRQNPLWVYIGKHKSLDIFQFNTYRHSTFPFRLNIYVNGMLHLRVHSCCEYKHSIGTRLGGSSGQFILMDIQGCVTCGRLQCENNRSVLAQISEQCGCHKSCGVTEEEFDSPCHTCTQLEGNSSASQETCEKCMCTGGYCHDGSASVIDSEDYLQEIKKNGDNLSEKGINSDKASYGSTTYEEAIRGTDRKKNNDMMTDSQKAPSKTEAEPEEGNKAEPKESKAAVPAEALPVGVKQSSDDTQIKNGILKQSPPSKTREPSPPHSVKFSSAPAKSPSPIIPSSTLTPPLVNPSPRPPAKSRSPIDPTSPSPTPPPGNPSRPPAKSRSPIDSTSPSPTPPPVNPSPRPPAKSRSPIDSTSPSPTPPPGNPSPRPPAKSRSPIDPTSPSPTPPPVNPSARPPAKSRSPIDSTSPSPTPPPVNPSPRPPAKSRSPIDSTSPSPTPPPVNPSPRPPAKSRSPIDSTSPSPTPPPVNPSPRPPAKSRSPIDSTSPSPTPPPVNPSPRPPAKSPSPIDPTSPSPTPPPVNPSRPPIKSSSPIEPTSLNPSPSPSPTPPPVTPSPQPVNSQPEKAEESNKPQKTDNTRKPSKETISKPSAQVVEKKDVGTDAISQAHVCTQVHSYNFMFDKSTETTFDNLMEEDSLTIITDYENSVLWRSSPIFASQ